jgi:hypothetical protein
MAKQRSIRDIPRNPREPGPRMRVKPIPPETMTVDEAARRLGISKSSALRGAQARRKCLAFISVGAGLCRVRVSNASSEATSRTPSPENDSPPRRAVGGAVAMTITKQLTWLRPDTQTP